MKEDGGSEPASCARLALAPSLSRPFQRQGHPTVYVIVVSPPPSSAPSGRPARSPSHPPLPAWRRRPQRWERCAERPHTLPPPQGRWPAATPAAVYKASQTLTPPNPFESPTPSYLPLFSTPLLFDAFASLTALCPPEAPSASSLPSPPPKLTPANTRPPHPSTPLALAPPVPFSPHRHLSHQPPSLPVPPSSPSLTKSNSQSRRQGEE